MTDVDPQIWDLSFTVSVSQRYYARRRAFFQSLHRLATLVSAFSGTGAFLAHRCPRALWISAIPSEYRCSSDFGALSRLAPDRAIPERGVGGWGAARLRCPLSGESLTAGCAPCGLGSVDVSESSSVTMSAIMPAPAGGR